MSDSTKPEAQQQPVHEVEETAFDISDAMESLQLPATARFCGYIVYVHRRAAFLAQDTDRAFTLDRRYVKCVEFALHFASRKYAERAAVRQKEPTTVGLVFKVGSVLRVAFDEG